MPRHLELLSLPALASALGISVFTLRKRRDLPRPLKLATKAYWFRSEVEHLLPRRSCYRDVVGPAELAMLLAICPDQLYRLVRAGVLPPPVHVQAKAGGRGSRLRSMWSRRNVEAHLRAQPR